MKVRHTSLFWERKKKKTSLAAFQVHGKSNSKKIKNTKKGNKQKKERKKRGRRRKT